MNQPTGKRRLTRLAARIEVLPFELIEPILKDLPLAKMLDLVCSTAADSRLQQAIEHSPTWEFIFKGRIQAFGRAWEHWSDIWRIPPEMPFLRRDSVWNTINLPASAGELKRFTGAQVLSRLQLQSLAFLRTGPWPGQQKRLQYIVTPLWLAISLFLPKELVQSRGSISSELEGFLNHDSYMSKDREFFLEHPVNQTYLEGFVDRLMVHNWTEKDAQLFYPLMTAAYGHLRAAWSAELFSLANLYERFPEYLHVALSPQTPRPNRAHVLKTLRRDAHRISKRPLDAPKAVYHGSSKLPRPYYRFRYPHPTLVPYDWCLRLFKTIVEEYTISAIARSCPPELEKHVKRASEGVEFIYHHGGISALARLQSSTTAEDASFRAYDHVNSAMPSPTAEIEWLVSFVTIVNWMTEQYPEITTSIRDKSLSNSPGSQQWDDVGYETYIQQASPQRIASQVLLDLALCDRKSRCHSPSLLALYLPAWPSPRAREIARYLSPVGAKAGIQQIIYDSKVSRIQRHLQNTPEVKSRDGQELAFELPRGTSLDNPEVDAHGTSTETSTEDSATKVTEDSLATTAETLHHLLKHSAIGPDASIADALAEALKLLETRPSVSLTGHPSSQASTKGSSESSWEKSVQRYLYAQPGGVKTWSCYICHLRVTERHPLFPALCVHCGEFNLAGSNLSLPPKLDLTGKVALVTGARVNLGFHVALRLLRCGARVIVSTRYPQDALTRYQSEKDAGDWTERLRIVGADFRAAKDAFDLVERIGFIVQEWGGTLHILINNAAQTLTDGIREEEEAVERESFLKVSSSNSLLLPPSPYMPRVRGGIRATIEGPVRGQLTAGEHSQPPMGSMVASAAKPEGSSWVQSLAEIPYEDVISAHSVNTFVPLILVRELLPLMSSGPATPTQGAEAGQSRYAEAYIVNVSSREGIFETATTAGHRGAKNGKNGKHVHTNMSKAALNMITETEAAPAWRQHRVAMNTVDPGYMSAAPEFQEAHGGKRPLGWEDGAGRVLWPVAMGERERVGEEGCHAVWGRFLKHYGAVSGDPRLGRG
ncbi:NAD(P)-binding protein [Xylariomycetidae sp. FL0641]|nr:NAD(P)-binding protein [Xylariomycetidae sp. FL0641]